ncbi:3-methyl-2-oxobutanoate hydroxymethyltransferase 3 [Aureimonas endophytica]|uniref:3-methyl-2-oxobutanoate hydroxymethyltransferase n=1 Tax=Aureimonas endophytica TaxID=2027858 RepID=A0A916ZY42_9HYPH|nr:3-methyl-2-oxobutanoate hydroxymethyltransferase [Aureimonas endophytica]GGE18774.1 3-methyl-2-oxobutanoate hydroxymethyltransferase 3 [Aureimonas endophytica]
MSAEVVSKRLTVPDITARKGGRPIVAITAYSALTARLVDRHADLILVGDSVAMVEHGMASTLGATLDMMILHGRSVMRGAARALVTVDLPFGSYEAGPDEAFRSAARVLGETGCTAVKLEGGEAMAGTVAFLAARGVPVVAHIGLTPQAVMALGGFRTQGRARADWDRIRRDAIAVAEAGAFAVVLEGIVEPLAAEITAAIPIPTIGIGASPRCDGQIIVLEDILGLSPRVPRFVKRFGSLGEDADAAIAAYAAAVGDRSFPGPDNVYQPKD